MNYILSAAKMRQYENYTIETIGVPSIVLMERAALCVVQEIKKLGTTLSHVLVVCGSGNNGGDGFAVARLLREENIDVEIMFAGNENALSPQTKKQWEIADSYQIPVNRRIEKKAYTIVVDAMFGIGLNRELSEQNRQLIYQINELKKLGALIISIDMPSGIDADTGKVMGAAVEAELTVTFAFAKIGQLLYPGAHYTGKLCTAQIGIIQDSFAGDYPKVSRIEAADLNLKKRPAYSNKGTFGKVLLIAGSEAMAGAAILSAKACMKSGAGMVQVITHEKNRDVLMQELPEAIVTTYGQLIDENKMEKAFQWADVIGIGPGLSLETTAKELLHIVFEKSRKPLVIDADAITLLAKEKELLKETENRTVIMTPHVGEFCRFTALDKETVLADFMDSVKSMAAAYGVICVCKDARTVIADKNGMMRINTTGNSGMATAGTGDVLFGMICSFLGQGMEPFDAASYGVLLHGLAGDCAKDIEGEHGMIASNLIDVMKNYLG